MNHRIALCGLLGLALPGASVFAQEAASPPAASPPANSGYVTREEYDKLKSQLDTVVKQMGDIKKEQTVSQAEVDKTIEDIEKDIHDNHRLINDLQLGSSKVYVGGDGHAGFTSQRKNDSTFDATFSPLLVWELDKNVLFEGALDISGSTANDIDGNPSSSTTTNLLLANITYTVCDNFYLGGGLFAVPFARYHQHFDAPWINKLPDDPLVFGDRAIAPSSETGVFGGGAVPMGSTKLEYNAYVANGPALITNGPAAGSLDFDDYTDMNNGKAYGGRIGFLPISQVDVGYSIQYSNPTPHGFGENVHALLQAVDVQYKTDIQEIAGTLEAKGEWVWSNVSKVTYDPDGTLGFGPTRFNNDRNGGYLQLGYRPSLVGNKIIKNFEVLVRYDAINASADAPGGGNEHRWTIGLDYWVTPSVVLKTAYEFDNKEVGPNQNTFLVQCGFAL